jgi:hypothetical protein
MMRFLMTLSVAILIVGGPAGAAHLSIKAEDCAEMVAHVPLDDVAYQPGTDGFGGTVLPADINNTGRIDYNTDDLIITIGHPLIAIDGQLGDQEVFVEGGGEIRPYGAELDAGYVTLQDGEVYFNDQRLTDNEARIVAAACAEGQ